MYLIIFQSTLSKRRATWYFFFSYCFCLISIHALQAESDLFSQTFDIDLKLNFNPRSPSGERQTASNAISNYLNFNPRSPSGERRLKKTRKEEIWINFNPRSPSGERLVIRMMSWLLRSNFNPRSPSGERLQTICIFSRIILKIT